MANDSNWGEIYLSTWWGDEFFNINSLSNDAAPKGFGYIGDEYPPVVAYSTHRVIGNSVYPSIRTRRSSDNGEQNIDYSINADLDVVGLDAFVGTQNLIFPSEDFGDASWQKGTGITVTSNTSETTDPFGGNAAAKIVSTNAETGFFQGGFSLPTSSDLIRSIYLKGAVGGETVVLKDPSGHGGSTAVTLTTEWQRFTHSTSAGVTDAQGLFVDDISVGTIYAFGAQCNEGTTAATYNKTTTGIGGDGGVVVFRDQVGTIYNKDTFDFSGGTDNFITTDSTNDKVERLESYQGVNDVVRWYVQNTNGGTHQARNNNGMQEHYRYLVSCKLYLPTNANITKLALYNGSDYFVVVDGATQSNEWVTITDYVFFGAANPRFFIIGLNDDEDLSFSATAGEEFYFADVVIDGDYSLSNTTADEQPLIVDGGTTETDDFIDFDGSNDRLVTQAIDAFQGDFTIDLEVDFPADVTTRQAIFTNRTTTSDRFGITIWNSNLYFDYYDGATYTGGRASGMTTGTYRITLTRASGVFTIYLNGTSQTIGSVAGLLGSSLDDQMTIGDYRNATNATNPFLGRVKTCIVYDSALDQAHATRFNEYLQ